MEKICSKCRKVKSTDEFHKNAGRPDGLRYNCKTCTNEMRKKYYDGNGKEIQSLYVLKRLLNPTLQDLDRQRQREYIKTYRFKNTLKVKARSAVYIATRAKTLTVSEKCELCESKEGVLAHHWHGYMPDHWLDVIWLCSKCHLVIEKTYKPNK